MAIYSANKPNRTVSLHKAGCNFIPTEKLNSCGCGDRGSLGNQRWYCEEHVSIDDINEFMNDRFWAILLCDKCFRDG